jgi:hypothetical protein
VLGHQPLQARLDMLVLTWPGLSARENAVEAVQEIPLPPYRHGELHLKVVGSAHSKAYSFPCLSTQYHGENFALGTAPVAL